MKIKKKYVDRYSSFQDFFTDEVLYNDFSIYNKSRGIEDQVGKLAELFGSLVETLVIRGVINVDDIDRIIGSWGPKVETKED